MRIGVIGINHKLADLELRECLAKTCQRRFGPGNSTHGDHTFILLSTCNRNEVYFSSDDLAKTHSYLLSVIRQDVSAEFDQKLYSYFGEDCFMHLARVTAGLDSAIVAETEIQGQVKAAYENSLEYISLPLELHYLFQKSLKIGKDTRTLLPLGRGMPDLEHAIHNTGMHMFKSPSNVKVLFIGASAINAKIIHFLKSKKIPNLTICNRSLSHASDLADTFQLSILPWEQLGNWQDYNWIIVGTKSPDYLLKNSHLHSQKSDSKLIMDLSVPRNVDPQLAFDPRLTLLNIDQLNRILQVRKKKMTETLFQAENMVCCSAKQQVELYQQKQRHRLRTFAAIA